MSTYQVIVAGKTSGTSRMTILQSTKSGEVQYLKEGAMTSQNCTFEIPKGLNILSAQLTGTITGNAYISCDSGQDITSGEPLIKYYGKGGTKDYSFGSFTKNPVGKEFNINESLGIISNSFSVSMQPDTKGTMQVVPPFNPINVGAECGRILSTFTNMKLTLNVQHNDPIIDNLSYIGEFWERDIVVNWRSSYQEGYEYELFYNNGSIKTGSGTTQNTFTIPSRTFLGTLPASVRVRVKNSRPDGTVVWSDWVERSISLKNIEATISNLIIEGDYYEKPIKLSWRSTDQEKFKIDVYKANTIVHTYTGNTETQYIIPADELESGEYSFRVTVAYSDRFVNYTERSVTLKDIQPTVSNLALSGSNIDLDLVLSWDSTDQQGFEYEIYKDDSRVKYGSGVTNKTVPITHNTLTTGLHKFKVRVSYKDRWSQWQEINVTLVEAMPSIGVLEPDGVIVDKDYPTRIWWTSSNQTKWKITLDGGTVYEGTWQTEHIIPGGVLQTGKHTINLIVTYVTGEEVEKTAYKNSEFIVQGKPPIPTFTNSNLFTTSRPIFTWDTQDQQGYILEILKEDKLIWTTEWQNGLVTRQKVLTYLENGQYIARLKIINQFSIESDYGKMAFSVDATENQSITLTCKKIKNAISLSWNNNEYRFNKFYILRNGLVIAKTSDTEYIDYFSNGECNYIIRGINDNDIYKDSNTCVIDGTIPHGILANVDTPSDTLSVGLSRGPYQFNGNINIEHSIIQTTGRENVVVIFGEHANNTYNINFTTRKDLLRFIHMCKRRTVFIYRDRYQTLYLSIPNTKYVRDKFGIKFSVTGIESHFEEVIDYD